ncbi:MAG: hypothetical protein K9N23_01550 [Akkermansiaceae bacterium]|nr:hypothetical protein [Akkermansiaceae bacterium]MCF7730335.1 hypothetical protein [Akkermansiaceae bacterium]
MTQERGRRDQKSTVVGGGSGFFRSHPVIPIATGGRDAEHPAMPKPTVTYSGESLFSMGMGQVVIARFKNDGRIEIGGFLLDTFCLGVKNAFFVQGDEEVLQDMVERIAETSGAVEEHSGAWGRKLVEAAANYARRLGFAPHRDYKKAARVLGGIDPKDCPDNFTFGSGGKPLFIAGPNDNQARCNLIISILTKKLGRDGFHFTVPMDDSGGFFDDEDEDDGDERP